MSMWNRTPPSQYNSTVMSSNLQIKKVNFGFQVPQFKLKVAVLFLLCRIMTF